MNADHKGVNILIVDDEKKACTNLKNILREYVDPDIHVVGIAHNTSEAERQIKQAAPDAVFLDIEMPKENAFHFLDRIAPFAFEVVFVTSFDEYAVKAFKLNAVDYILKPIGIDELQNAVVKLKEKIRYKKIISGNSDYLQLAEQMRSKTVPQKIVLRNANTTEVTDFRNICFVEAQSSYSRIVFLKDNVCREVIMSNPLSDYEELLPGNIFYRIHRSYLVNCQHIKNITKEDSYKVVLKENFELPVSRRRYATLMDFLKSNQQLYENMSR